jgi:hypothetical protein
VGAEEVGADDGIFVGNLVGDMVMGFMLTSMFECTALLKRVANVCCWRFVMYTIRLYLDPEYRASSKGILN